MQSARPSKLIIERPGASRRLAKEIAQSTCEGITIFELAFPYNQGLPTKRLQVAQYASIAFHVFRQLRCPKVMSRFRRFSLRTSSVVMPKAAVHEDDLAARGKDKIGRTRQTFFVKPVTIPQRMNETPNRHFNVGVFRSHPGHEAAAFDGYC